jgi:redox-sensitive bicupin YhaK (pirin superfamily)
MQRKISRTARVIPLGSNSQVQMKQRVMGDEGYEKTSPFLFLSEDWFAPPGGFEEHPHRGMQTVTFILEGMLEHRDHTGAHGVLKAGDVQWMTAGRGVLHSEMPQGPVHTLQLWLNLPARMKMIPARYKDQPLADVPVRQIPGGEVRVYAGKSGDVQHKHGSDWPISLMDIRLAGTLDQEVLPKDRGFLYVLEGGGEIGGRPVKQGEVAWYEPGEGDTLRIEGKLRVLHVAGEPIVEPVVAYGPFVMNTRQEIVQAFEDYQSGRLVSQE